MRFHSSLLSSYLLLLLSLSLWSTAWAQLLRPLEPADCPPVMFPTSICPRVMVDLPVNIKWNEPQYGLGVVDVYGVPTGFTYCEASSFGSDNGYVPGHLRIDNTRGFLAIIATPGNCFEGRNNQLNRIGVGLPPPSTPYMLRTVLLSPPTGADFEQAGLWAGGDEDNYVKLCLIGMHDGVYIQLLAETAGRRTALAMAKLPPAPYPSLALQMELNPYQATAVGYYWLESGSTPTLVGSIKVPNEVFSFDAATIDPRAGTTTFAGVFVSQVNGPGSVIYNFQSFAAWAEQGQKVEETPDGIRWKRVDNKLPFSPTNMVLAPNGVMYATSYGGYIYGVRFDRNGKVFWLKQYNTLVGQLTLGIAVDPRSSANNIVLWVSHSTGDGGYGSPGLANSGKISRLSGRDFTTRMDVITGIGRSMANHAINSLHFAPNGVLLFSVGSNTEGGSASTLGGVFGIRGEQMLTAGLFQADVLANWWKPHIHGQCATLVSTTTGWAYPGYPSTCAVRPYATGIRNMYDFAWHPVHKTYYGADNGVGLPATVPIVRAPGTCQGIVEYTLPVSPLDPGTQSDVLYNLKRGKYYGHPNPARKECVFGDGSFQGQPTPRNYEPPLLPLGVHVSADGMLVYRSGRFCGRLRGHLLAAAFSVGNNIVRISFNSDGSQAYNNGTVASNFLDPIALEQDNYGNVYVASFNQLAPKHGYISVLMPDESKLKCRPLPSLSRY